MIPSIFGMCCSCKRKETPEDKENIQQTPNQTDTMNSNIPSLDEYITKLKKDLENMKNSYTKKYQSVIGQDTSNENADIITNAYMNNKLDEYSYYKNLKVVKKLNACYDSEVYLLKNNIIKKRYPKTPVGNGQFENEFITYKYLRSCPFIPKLLYVNKSYNELYIEYIGRRAHKNRKNIEKIEQCLKQLNHNWHIKRLSSISWSNVVERDGQLYLIDFGGIPWKYKPRKIKWEINHYMIKK